MSLIIADKKNKAIFLLVTIVILVTIAALIWLFYPRYVLLSSEVGVEQASLLERLENVGLDYKVDEQGNTLVESSSLGKGMIAKAQDQQSGFNSHGLELYDEADYSMTEHTQQVTLMRALQGELERTISALDYIRYARVHLTFGEKKMFDKQGHPAKAAVTLFPEQSLNKKQIEGVQALIAAAVPSLKAEAVTILSDDGSVLSRSNDDGQSLAVSRLQQQIELEYRQKIENLLGVMFAPADYSVAASVDLNISDRRTLKQELLTDSSGSGTVVQKQKSIVKNQDNDSTAKAEVSNENTDIRYAHGTAVEEVTMPAGAVIRKAISVLIRSEVNLEKQSQLQSAIEVAVGFNAERGDQVIVQFIGVSHSNSLLDHAKSDDLSSSNTGVQSSIHQTDISNTILVISALCLLVILLVSLKRKPNLSVEKRQELLEELQQWLNQGRASRD